MTHLTLEHPFGMRDHQMFPKKSLRRELFVTEFTGEIMGRGLQVVIQSFCRRVSVLTFATLKHLLLPCLLVSQMAVGVKIELPEIGEFCGAQMTSELAVLVLLGVLQELLKVLEHFGAIWSNAPITFLSLMLTKMCFEAGVGG